VTGSMSIVRQLKSVINSMVNGFNIMGIDNSQQSKALWPSWNRVWNDISRSEKKRTHIVQKAPIIDLPSLTELHRKFNPANLTELRLVVIIMTLTFKCKRPADLLTVKGSEEHLQVFDGMVQDCLTRRSYFKRKIILTGKGLKNVNVHTFEGMACNCHTDEWKNYLESDNSPVSNHNCNQCRGSPCRFMECVDGEIATGENCDKTLVFKMCEWKDRMS
jgi:hypothetical protein